MAETAHLYLKLSGTDIKGDSTQGSLGRADSIECLYFESEVQTAREAGSGMATGRRQYLPIVLRKRIDKSSPLLAKGLTENQQADGIIKFFRPAPSGDGTTQQFYTIAFKQGRIASLKVWNPDTIEPATATMPAMEEVSFVFHTISWTFVDGGVEHVDTWDQNR